MRTATAAALALAIVSTIALAQKDRPPAAGENQASPPRTAAAPVSSSDPAVAPNYVIGAGDILQISVWQEPQFGETVEVRPDGKISLPLVSDVAVAGITSDGAANRITSKLQGFVKHPLVTVVVTEVHSKVVYVIGQVERPGPYPLAGPINVAQLIARAGGATQHAKEKQVYVLRAGQSGKIPVNYQKVLQGKETNSNIELIPGDTVVVP